jgi:hypothetical protein
MRHFLATISLLCTLGSCSSNGEKNNTEINFSTNRVALPTDTTIRAIANFDGYLLLLQDNGKFVALDTAYKRVEFVEKKLATLKGSFLFQYDDTVFIGTNDRTFYLNADCEPLEYKDERRKYGNVLLEDSAYLVYGCCAGEWGGSVFFRSKQTGKTYSYFATCPSQVLQFGRDYVVCNNLSHMGDRMNFLVVTDPTTLYEITDERLKNHCNWYVTIDSLKGYWQVSKKGSVRFYETSDAMSLITFPFGDSLYSVVSLTDATVVAVHKGDTAITRDTLFHKRVAFHETTVIDLGKKKVCLYRLTEGSPVAAYITRGNNTGLIVVGGNTIDFLEREPARSPK